MLLQSLLQTISDKHAQQIIKMVISQINLLLCLVNDILDLKMIELGRFVTRKEAFNPVDVFNFILSMFNLTAQH